MTWIWLKMSSNKKRHLGCVSTVIWPLVVTFVGVVLGICAPPWLTEKYVSHISHKVNGSFVCKLLERSPDSKGQQKKRSDSNDEASDDLCEDWRNYYRQHDDVVGKKRISRNHWFSMLPWRPKIVDEVRLYNVAKLDMSDVKLEYKLIDDFLTQYEIPKITLPDIEVVIEITDSIGHYDVLDSLIEHIGFKNSRLIECSETTIATKCDVTPRLLSLGSESALVQGSDSVDGGSLLDTIRGHRLQRWRVVADSARRVSVVVRSEEVDAVLYVVLADSVLYSDDGVGPNSLLEFTMPDSGVVSVFAGGYGPDAEGSYQLIVRDPLGTLSTEETVRRDPLRTPSTEEIDGVIKLGSNSALVQKDGSVGDSSLLGVMYGHRLQGWRVETDAAKRVSVVVRSEEMDAVLYVVLADSVLYSDDEVGRNSLLEFTMPDSGVVSVFAGGYGPDAEGSYQLIVGDQRKLLLELDSEKKIELDSNTALVQGSDSVDGGSLLDTIRGHRLQEWRVVADSARRVSVAVRSEEIDAVLYVVLADSVLYSDDGVGRNSLLEFAMPDSGVVSVFAGGYGPDAEGSYQLIVGDLRKFLLDLEDDERN